MQLAAPCGRAQCPATPRGTRAPAPSPVACLAGNIPGPSGHCQPPCPPRPACSVNCGSKHPIKPSCAQRGRVGQRKAAIWVGARPTYRLIPVYIRQLFILTWRAAGAGQRGHRAGSTCRPQPCPGHRHLPAAAAGSGAQHPALGSPGNSPGHPAEGGCSAPGISTRRNYQPMAALSAPPPKRTQRILTPAVGRKSQLLVLKRFLWLDLKNHRRFFALLCPNCTASTIFGTSSPVKIIII